MMTWTNNYDYNMAFAKGMGKGQAMVLGKGGGKGSKGGAPKAGTMKNGTNGDKKCHSCDSPDHVRSQCPHVNDTCSWCQDVGHIAKACRRKRRGEPKVTKAVPGATTNTTKNQVGEKSYLAAVTSTEDVVTTTSKLWWCTKVGCFMCNQPGSTKCAKCDTKRPKDNDDTTATHIKNPVQQILNGEAETKT